MKRAVRLTPGATLLITTGFLLLIASCSESSSVRYANQGTPSAPVTVIVGQTHGGSIGAYGTSFYRFTTTVGGVYTIALTRTASDLSWELYDNNFEFMMECDEFWVRADETCSTPSLAPATTYHLKVEEWDRVGGRFNLLVSAP